MFDSVRRIALIAAAPVALLGLTTPPALATAAVPPTTESLLMAEVVERTNEIRQLAGCDELSVDDELVVASVRQAHYMAATGDFSHFGWRGSTFQTRSRAAGYEHVAGENIAWGFGDVGQVMDAWMASPGHRENILNCDYQAFGAGVQRTAEGTYYWTQVFGWR